MGNRAAIHRRKTIGASGTFILFVCLMLSVGDIQARPAQPIAGGGSGPVAQDALSPAQYRRIQAQIASSRRQLIQQGKLRQSAAATSVRFEWPLHAAQAAADYGYHGISNFVDHNPAAPNQLLDYNNGARTYDLSNGYNHQGTDIYLWPFAWQKMDAGAIEVVAAADGVIVYKSDGQFDRSCSLNNNDWNAVYVEHSDGTVAWYGHLKDGSITAKPNGAAVAAGEYLGLVGSSGSSTGPHLHFEVHDQSDNVIDPFFGPANPTVDQSLWDAQPAYYDSAINHLGTGTAPPVFPSCPSPETSNEQSSFDPGSQIYFTAYYRDQRAGQVSQFSIYQPDNSVYDSWTHSSPATYYSSSFWYWNYVLPADAPLGAWRFEVVYQGQTYQHIFYIGPALTPRVAVPLVQR